MKKYIILHPTLQIARKHWERLQKFKWLFPKAQCTCNNTNMKLWDILGNEYFFTCKNDDNVCRGRRANEIWIDDFSSYPKEILK